MQRIITLLNSRPFLWVMLAVPGLLMLRHYVGGGVWAEDMLHPTGEWSARLIVFALMLTPLAMLFRGRRWVLWLVSRRRAFGVAAFAYAFLHLAFYLIEMASIRDILAELGALGIWTGWAAFFLLLPLAATSNQASVRALKAGWKRLQRLAYPAAVLTLAHWMFVHDGRVAALATFAPLAVLQAWRAVHIFRAGSWRSRRSAPA
jgi:sulfoxide reductase heme-binding subunit YedZ